MIVTRERRLQGGKVEERRRILILNQVNTVPYLGTLGVLTGRAK